jgi:hypothetical protein
MLPARITRTNVFFFGELRITQLFLAGLEIGMVKKDAVSKDFRKQLLGYGLTTAEIVYRRPFLEQRLTKATCKPCAPRSRAARLECFPFHLQNEFRGSL